MLATQDIGITSAPTVLSWPVPVYQEPAGRLRAALKAKRPIYVALVDGYRDNAHFYGTQFVIEQFPVESAAAVTETVNTLTRRYNNDRAAQSSFQNAPWYAILITEKPTFPSKYSEPLADID